MPQNFQVLRCYSCSVFQVHPTKKCNKFECKLCGEKQSIKRHFGLGTGKECRIHVQKLNAIRRSANEMSCSLDEEDSGEFEDSNENISVNDVETKRESKWLEYADKNKVNSVPNDAMYLGDTEVVLEIPKKKKIYSRNNKFNKDKNTFDIDHLDNGFSKQCRKRKSFIAEQNIEINSSTILKGKVKIEPSLNETKIANDGLKNNVRHFITTIVSNSSWDQYAEINENIEQNETSFDLNELNNAPQEQSQLNLIRNCEDKSKNFNISYGFKDEHYATNKFENIKSPSKYFNELALYQEKKLPTKFVQPVVKESKWAQYIIDDNIKENLQHQIEPRSHHQTNTSCCKPQILFSLSDDCDLDTLLDI